jgi:hypothetical protein
MHAISFVRQPTMKVNIRNHCSDFHLKNLRCFSIGVNWNKYPSEEVYVGGMMSADLISSSSIFEGVLTYDLKRKGVESTYIRLFVAWKSEGYKRFHMFLRLIEHDERYKWNKNELEEYCQRYASQLCTYTGPIKDTWLIPDGTVLMTELELDFTQRDGVLKLTISEGIRDEHIRRPKWLNLKR